MILQRCKILCFMVRYSTPKWVFNITKICFFLEHNMVYQNCSYNSTKFVLLQYDMTYPNELIPSQKFVFLWYDMAYPNDSIMAHNYCWTCLDCLVESYVYLANPIDSFAHDHGLHLNVCKQRNKLAWAIWMHYSLG